MYIRARPDESATTGVAHLDGAACANAPEWAPNVAYATGAVVRYAGRVYKVTQGHTSLAGWAPDIVPALFQPADCAGGGAPNHVVGDIRAQLQYCQYPGR